MLALFDRLDLRARELLRSLATAGVEVTPVVIRYEGELPDGMLCPFVTYTGLDRTGEPLFFDEVPVPEWCEIRQGKARYGEILRDGVAIGRIHYEPNSFRQVQSVDWLLPDATVDRTDHYDRYGNRYATTHRDGGAAYQTVYRGPGEWTIEVDHVTRAVTLRSARRLLAFETLTDFVSHYVNEQDLHDDRLLIDSLSFPLFVARRRAREPRAVLFWQEPMPGEVPGNMAMELERPRALARIVFTDERQRRKVAERYPSTPVELDYLSHLDQFADHRDYDPRRVFTLTNTDELPGLVGLLEAFPEVTFSVAALTLMSERLHALGRRYPNLTLIPTITQARIRDELARASVYLDIDAGPHVLDVVPAAYYLDLVVLADAAHAKDPDRSLALAAPELAARLAEVTASPEGRARVLDALHTQRGPLSTPEEYRRLLLGE